jgi:hypothetical protein
MGYFISESFLYKIYLYVFESVTCKGLNVIVHLIALLFIPANSASGLTRQLTPYSLRNVCTVFINSALCAEQFTIDL